MGEGEKEIVDDMPFSPSDFFETLLTSPRDAFAAIQPHVFPENDDHEATAVATSSSPYTYQAPSNYGKNRVVTYNVDDPASAMASAIGFGSPFASSVSEELDMADLTSAAAAGSAAGSAGATGADAQPTSPTPLQAMTKFFSLDNMEQYLSCVNLTVDPRSPNSRVAAGGGSKAGKNDGAFFSDEDDHSHRFTKRETAEFSFMSEREAVMNGEMDMFLMANLINGDLPRGGDNNIVSSMATPNKKNRNGSAAVSKHVNVPGGLWSLPSDDEASDENEMNEMMMMNLSVSVDSTTVNGSDAGDGHGMGMEGGAEDPVMSMRSPSNRVDEDHVMNLRSPSMDRRGEMIFLDFEERLENERKPGGVVSPLDMLARQDQNEPTEDPILAAQRAVSLAMSPQSLNDNGSYNDKYWLEGEPHGRVEVEEEGTDEEASEVEDDPHYQEAAPDFTDQQDEEAYDKEFTCYENDPEEEISNIWSSADPQEVNVDDIIEETPIPLSQEEGDEEHDEATVKFGQVKAANYSERYSEESKEYTEQGGTEEEQKYSEGKNEEEDDNSSYYPNPEVVPRFVSGVVTLDDSQTSYGQYPSHEQHPSSTHQHEADIMHGVGHQQHQYSNDEEANEHFDRLMASFELSLTRNNVTSLSDTEQRDASVRAERSQSDDSSGEREAPPPFKATRPTVDLRGWNTRRQLSRRHRMFGRKGEVVTPAAAVKGTDAKKTLSPQQENDASRDHKDKVEEEHDEDTDTPRKSSVSKLSHSPRQSRDDSFLSGTIGRKWIHRVSPSSPPVAASPSPAAIRNEAPSTLQDVGLEVNTNADEAFHKEEDDALSAASHRVDDTIHEEGDEHKIHSVDSHSSLLMRTGQTVSHAAVKMKKGSQPDDDMTQKSCKPQATVASDNIKYHLDEFEELRSNSVSIDMEGGDHHEGQELAKTTDIANYHLDEFEELRSASGSRGISGDGDDGQQPLKADNVEDLTSISYSYGIAQSITQRKQREHSEADRSSGDNNEETAVQCSSPQRIVQSIAQQRKRGLKQERGLKHLTRIRSPRVSTPKSIVEEEAEVADEDCPDDERMGMGAQSAPKRYTGFEKEEDTDEDNEKANGAMSGKDVDDVGRANDTSHVESLSPRLLESCIRALNSGDSSDESSVNWDVLAYSMSDKSSTHGITQGVNVGEDPVEICSPASTPCESPASANTSDSYSGGMVATPASSTRFISDMTLGHKLDKDNDDVSDDDDDLNIPSIAQRRLKNDYRKDAPSDISVQTDEASIQSNISSSPTEEGRPWDRIEQIKHQHDEELVKIRSMMSSSPKSSRYDMAVSSPKAPPDEVGVANSSDEENVPLSPNSAPSARKSYQVRQRLESIKKQCDNDVGRLEMELSSPVSSPRQFDLSTPSLLQQADKIESLRKFDMSTPRLLQQAGKMETEVMTRIDAMREQHKKNMDKMRHALVDSYHDGSDRTPDENNPHNPEDCAEDYLKRPASAVSPTHGASGTEHRSPSAAPNSIKNEKRLSESASSWKFNAKRFEKAKNRFASRKAGNVALPSPKNRYQRKHSRFNFDETTSATTTTLAEKQQHVATSPRDRSMQELLTKKEELEEEVRKIRILSPNKANLHSATPVHAWPMASSSLSPTSLSLKNDLLELHSTEPDGTPTVEQMRITPGSTHTINLDALSPSSARYHSPRNKDHHLLYSSSTAGSHSRRSNDLRTMISDANAQETQMNTRISGLIADVTKFLKDNDRVQDQLSHDIMTLRS